MSNFKERITMDKKQLVSILYAEVEYLKKIVYEVENLYAMVCKFVSKDLYSIDYSLKYNTKQLMQFICTEMITDERLRDKKLNKN